MENRLVESTEPTAEAIPSPPAILERTPTPEETRTPIPRRRWRKHYIDPPGNPYTHWISD